MNIETTIVVTAVVLWFAQGWYLNTRLERVHAKLDKALECFDGLREYLYEIDPQFNDERGLISDLDDSLESGSASFAGMSHNELITRKASSGRRTLDSTFHRS